MLHDLRDDVHGNLHGFLFCKLCLYQTNDMLFTDSNSNLLHTPEPELQAWMEFTDTDAVH